MGFSISWVGVENVPKATALERLNLRDIGVADVANSASLSAAETPTGWTILRAKCYDYASPTHMPQICPRGNAIACQIEEHVMASAAYGFLDGKQLWGVEHQSDRGKFDLRTTGHPPETLSAIVAELTARQRQETMRVDHAFDAPVELAATIAGFRHDHAPPPGVNFTALDAPGSPSAEHTVFFEWYLRREFGECPPVINPNADVSLQLRRIAERFTGLRGDGAKR